MNSSYTSVMITIIGLAFGCGSFIAFYAERRVIQQISTVRSNTFLTGILLLVFSLLICIVGIALSKRYDLRSVIMQFANVLKYRSYSSEQA